MKYAYAAFAIAALVSACSPPTPRCITGESRACTGAGGCSGGQVCLADGTFGACDCGSRDGGSDVVVDVVADSGDDTSTDAGPDAAGDVTADVATDVATDTGTDGSDDAAADAGPTSCDPVGQTGCTASQRCTWAHSGTNMNVPTCQPDGTIALGAACTVDTEFDACRRGGVCDGTVCAAPCNAGVMPTGCDAMHTCTLFAGGEGIPASSLCVPACDPVTQRRSTDGAAACGSVDPLNPNRTCVGDATGFQCASVTPAAAMRTSDVVVPPPVYLNSCAPGFMPLLLTGTGSTSVICVAFCQPAPTSLESHPNPGGVAGSGYTCADRGAGGTHECRYWWSLEAMPPYSMYGNTVGFCEDYTRYQYDANHDGTPDTQIPSCTTLSTTAHNFDPTLSDAQAWGCVPSP